MNVKFIFAAPPRRQKILSGEAYLVHSKRIYSNSDQYVAALYKVVGTFLFGAAVSQSLTDYSVHSSFGMYCMLFLAILCVPRFSSGSTPLDLPATWVLAPCHSSDEIFGGPPWRLTPMVSWLPVPSALEGSLLIILLLTVKLLMSRYTKFSVFMAFPSTLSLTGVPSSSPRFTSWL
ncbi:uncharacterized protein LOC122886437 isoform X1 [Siniperca chuatsi]|uniref:uncharacterized protein LOC122886437 isoform X1 n=1 Tax=Siniperca chuatsi TaxID=119488 RepID=UPI001CE078F5|nr:uncharacterized protein LOC122886437 isoform X1 [Siniperca chuatsi]